MNGNTAFQHSYCFMCSTYFYDQLVETCPRCQARVSGLTQRDLTDLGLLHRTLPADSHHSPAETAIARPTAA